MNYLAHLFLSGDDPKILIGNYIADGLKKKDKKTLDPRILEGVNLHYKIDDFIDLHPIFSRSKQLLFPKYGHYSSVILDIFYDHFLAINWSHFSPLKLDKYESLVYDLLEVNKNQLPPRSLRFLSYMKSTTVLSNYATIPGISRVLRDFSGRAKSNSKIEESPGELVEFYQDFNSDFLEFFPIMIRYVNSQECMKDVHVLSDSFNSI